MIISLMLLVSNTSLLASALVATSDDRQQPASGYVISDGQRAPQRGLADPGVDVAQAPDEWPFAL